MYSTLCQLRVWIQDGMKTEKGGCMMRRGRRRAGVFRAAAFSLIWGLALSAGITAWAETDEYEEYEDEYEENAYTAIDSVTLEVYSDIRAGDMYGDVEVSGDEDGYTVDKAWRLGLRIIFPPVFREAILFWKEMREAYPPFRKNPVPCG